MPRKKSPKQLLRDELTAAGEALLAQAPPPEPVKEVPAPPAEPAAPTPEPEPYLTPHQIAERKRKETIANATHPVDLMSLASAKVLVDGRELSKEQSREVRRLLRRAKAYGSDKLGFLKRAEQLLVQAAQMLEQADTREGRGVRFAVAQAEKEKKLLTQLHTSVTNRTRDAAFALAELEQAIDPIEGLRILGLRERVKNARVRKRQTKKVP